MNGFSLTSRAVVFAICAGALAFILALFATSHGSWSAEHAATALIPAIVCAVMCWAAAERTVAGTASAIDSAIERLAQAANGDLQSPIPGAVSKEVPQLADAMDGLFQQLHANLESVQRLAMFDPVTGLPNRVSFRRNCERQLAELPRDGKAALFFVDLDRFKTVNDTLGHATGDALLGMVANRLRAVADRYAATTGAAPLIGRLAGDEFTLFFGAVANAGEASRIGRGILFAMNEPFDIAEQEITVGASVGIAMRPDHGATLADLMRAADAAMYRAKAAGRGRVEHFSDNLAAEIADSIQLESDLREAIDQQQFGLVFQPQISVRRGEIVAAEALLRWRHPDGERLPASFIRRAEETGLIVEIGDWVVAEVAKTITRWADAGVEQRLAINVSQRQLDHVAFFRGLRQAMQNARAPAAMLELEISETLAMNCNEDVIDAIAALRRDGATISIDDFGTGYSNLARLRELPLDRVKLDPSMIANVVESTEARAVIQAVISLVHGLQYEVVAEGIESSAQAKVLGVIGCDVLQGYAVARPMPEDAFIAWARNRDDRAAVSA
ncbi:putative bifunctional diguanylate cyclase/phosphodiesterase [Stakelama marina]|uniref:EAL domain-containing protein n=1 Tax=Stakelama marina TaxID=2826939 RepID=A0A8T4ICF2_9SPHN|nr:EAL domain-containing protein [Stakelama marina]MBR0552071.1 EAL domain-containing protein [Stakelama marina]